MGTNTIPKAIRTQQSGYGTMESIGGNIREGWIYFMRKNLVLWNKYFYEIVRAIILMK